MFIKRKTRTGKTYAYLMLVSFKTSLTYKKNNFTKTTVSVVKEI